jgi:uncharacterized protein
MPDDDFSRPLGLAKKRAPARGSLVAWLLLSSLGGLAIAGFVLLNLRGDPFGGEPHALAYLEKQPPQPPTTTPSTPPADSTAQASEPANTSIVSATDVETQSGVKIVRSHGAAPPGALIIDVPQALGARLAPAPDRRLVEKSRYGPLPRIGADGARPADVYARPVVAGLTKVNGPRIALVIGGMGLSQATTTAAINSLPPAVTLAFAPYGSDLGTVAAQARDAGHEIILQLPMEPIDYPQTNPGPHALLTTKSTAETIDDLHWLMSRFTGYIGVSNFLGAKFAADEKAMAPVLQDIAGRGLIYFDDASSPHGIPSARAAEVNLTAVKADLVLDAVARPDAIDAALKKLEAIARERGIAIGTASALPVSLDRLGRFARDAESHGIVLIPLSAARNVARVSEDARALEPPH